MKIVKLFGKEFFLADKIDTEINNLSDKMDEGFKAQSEKFDAKIDGIDKRLTLGFSLMTAMLAALVALHFLGH